ncbi:MAG: hypothetical protein A2408_01385 [Candidatus Yonathbacteria bacterium RIFOXYC1_FULL_52_10]|uniref:Peptidase M50 domain-containing protein n=1 Tax=Candidatus Yonathbacteria bacterium RIFOXYD1_FULL_52_36 TaxID=1802730 RepID=A0A1G2SJH9_9BACT|nr:MAG: hypothetical protein A2591_01030 [Candidatus Yonathbacteria bacterium RIFOXYD1_FULL_52_36]OHA85542.1 MAG: hypothetical protein A2408_01385 [Candidatus Yonathbacteria bacterium RIFOXYC1_FULL_52_10]
MQADIIFYVLVLIMSVVIHEVSHGYMANILGDPTARLAGRLTLNPLPHIDPLGSVILPATLVLMHSNILFGWAKPVPYNPYNLRNQRWGTALVGAAGVLANLLLAFVFGMIIRFGAGLPPAFIEISAIIVFVNALLAVFNLLPVPPLDGAKVLFAVLPVQFRHIEETMEQYWYVLIIPVILFAGVIVIPATRFIFALFAGTALPL